jgi:hypothetical protein
MSKDTAVAALLPSLGIAAFEQNADGAFEPLAPAPAWFAGLGKDGTFPFLGHILEEAVAFWASRTDGVREWGPCVDVDDNGQEFHYVVKAVTVGARAFLVFQLDEGAERMRDVLQRVRSDALEQARQRE